MRGPAIIAIALAVVGCTAPNPDFGETSGTGTSTSTTRADTSTSSIATMSATTAMPETTDDPTEDPSTSTGGVDPATTGEPSFECCDQNDCSEEVLSCVCPLAQADCCSGEWGPTCPDIAVACGGVCDGVEYSCCQPRAEPACTGIQNLGGFCFSNPSCCLVAWEPACVAAYDEATNECGLEACDVPHGTPGCADPDAMNCVCLSLELPQCCTEMWHEACVEALASCG